MELLFLFVVFIIFGVGAGIYKLIRWILEPIIRHFSHKDTHSVSEEGGEETVLSESEEETSDEPEEQVVIVKSPKFDTSRIKEYKPDEKIKITKFTPHTWNEYIGQKNAKKIIKSFISGTQKINAPFPHTIIDGSAGFGKTTLVRLLQKYLNAEIIEYIASELTDVDQIIDILNKINSSKAKNLILFIDEVHNLSPKLIEIFYPILQEGKINDKYIRPFSFCGCTTEKGMLIKRFKPFIDRMMIHITLQNYNIEEMKQIITQYKEQVFSDIQISNEIYTILAKNSRLTPRKANRLIESFIYIGDIDKTLEVYEIIDKERGLTKTDIKILNYLANNDKVGLQGLSAYLDTSADNYLYQHEPYLIQLNLISRTPRGRSISEKGKELLKGLNDEN